jgi:ketosteroid isomerase-like protein
MATIKATWLACASALLCFALSVPLTAPAFADDADITKAAPQMASAYMDVYNKQDATGLAALYAPDAVVVNPAGIRQVNLKFFEGFFVDGPRRLETVFDQAWPLTADTALGAGTFRITGTTLKGEPVDLKGRWTGTYVRQDGKWKIRLLTTMSLPPPAK